jgi:glyoxylase-like metal-dependent hydrolase (beta-lactamase superfamily II)
MIKVHVLACGSTTVDEALPFSSRSRNPLAFTGLFRGKRHKIQVPVRAYLIEHPQGLVLIDTGWDEAIRTDARRYEGFANYFASPGMLPEGEGIRDQLAQLGYAIDDIDAVLMTHLDIDHAGGLQMVKNVPEIYCSEKEWNAAQKTNPRYLKRLWKDVLMKTFRDQLDLYDHTITSVAMPGHSAGMTAYRIGTMDRYLLIAGDAGYGRASYEDPDLPGVEWNRQAAMNSLKRLQKIASDPHCIDILMTHDTEEKQTAYEI